MTAATARADDDFSPLSDAEQQEVWKSLKGRSFRQFGPTLDSDPRKGVIIEFGSGADLSVKVWAQHASGGRAEHEWEIRSSEIELSKAAEAGIYKISMAELAAKSILGDDEIEAEDFEFQVHVRKGRGETMFRFNSDTELPLPFPLFEDWTKFREPQRFNGG